MKKFWTILLTVMCLMIIPITAYAAELPSTGGIGVIVLYIIDGILIIGAAVYFIIRFNHRKKH